MAAVREELAASKEAGETMRALLETQVFLPLSLTLSVSLPPPLSLSRCLSSLSRIWS